MKLRRMYLIYFLIVVSTINKNSQSEFPIQVLIFRPNSVIRSEASV